MWLHLILFAGIYITGEFLINYTAFIYIKRYFKIERKITEAVSEKIKDPTFLGLHISTFKGLLERFVLYVALVLGIQQILIVFGALKIGTRLAAKGKVENDYFIVGNFTSILSAIGYMYTYQLLKLYFEI